MTYVLLSVAVLAGVFAATVTTLARLGWRAIGLAALVLIALTAIFDNVIVGVGLVDYDDDKISGLRVPYAPIEDFSYTLGAVMLIPAVWTWLGRARDRPREEADA